MEWNWIKLNEWAGKRSVLRKVFWLEDICLDIWICAHTARTSMGIDLVKVGCKQDSTRVGEICCLNLWLFRRIQTKMTYEQFSTSISPSWIRSQSLFHFNCFIPLTGFTSMASTRILGLVMNWHFDCNSLRQHTTGWSRSLFRIRSKYTSMTDGRCFTKCCLSCPKIRNLGYPCNLCFDGPFKSPSRDSSCRRLVEIELDLSSCAGEFVRGPGCFMWLCNTITKHHNRSTGYETIAVEAPWSCSNFMVWGNMNWGFPVVLFADEWDIFRGVKTRRRD